MNPVVALIVANVIWGGASPIFKFALVNIPPFTLAFIRFFGAAILLLPLAISRWQRLTLRNLIEICIAAFFGITLNIAAFFLGIQKTASINAPIIASIGPVVIYLLSLLFLKEKPRLKVLVGMFLSLFGVMVIILSPIFLDGKTMPIGQIEGNLFLLLAALGAVLNTIINKDILKKVNASVLTFISFSFGALTFFPFMLSELESWRFSQLNVQGWTGIVYGVVFSSALAYFLFNYAMSKLQAQEVGLFTYVDPIAAVIIAMPLLGEYPNLYFVVGSLLVFWGIYVAEGRIHWHPFHKLIK